MTYDGNCLDGEYDYDQVYDWRNKKWVDLDKNNEIKDTTFFIQELDNDDDLDMVYDLVKNEWVGIDKKDKNKYWSVLGNEIKTTVTHEHVCKPPHPLMNVWSICDLNLIPPTTCDKCGWSIEPKTKTTIVRGGGYAYGHTEHTS